MLSALTFRLTSVMNRWSGAAPAACCGACKPCVTTAAANLTAVAVGVGLETVSSRRSSEDGERPVVLELPDSRPTT